MPDQNTFGADVAQAIHDLENHLDLALAAGGRLTTLATQGRVDLGLTALVGGTGLERVLASLALVGQARSETVKAHGAFARDARRIGIDWQAEMSGPVHKPDGDGDRGGTPLLKSDDALSAQPAGELRLVA